MTSTPPRLTPEAEARLKTIAERSTRRLVTSGTNEAAEVALSDLVASGELEAALPLLPIGLQARGTFAKQVFATLHALVRTASPRELAWLDQRRRERSEYRPWRPAPAPREKIQPGLPVAALGIASFEPSGWVRETAVRALSASSDALALPFLILRANDWVEQVASVAREGLKRWIAPESIDALVPWLPLLVPLAQVRRNDLTALFDSVTRSFATPAARRALLAACRSTDVKVRRWSVSLALQEHATCATREVFQSALSDIDPIVRRTAARQAGVLFDGDELTALLFSMLKNRAHKVREAALELLDARGDPELLRVVTRSLLDPSAQTRSTARRLLEPRGFDIGGFYRDWLAEHPHRQVAPALDGLAHVGRPSDASLAARFLGNPSVRARVAAVRAIARFKPGGFRADMVGRLSDPSPRVSRAARDVLRKQSPLDSATLMELALHGRFAHVRQAALELARASDYWMWGLLALRLAQDGDPQSMRIGESALGSWIRDLNKRFSKPTREQVAEFEVRVASLKDRELRQRFVKLIPTVRLRGEQQNDR